MDKILKIKQALTQADAIVIGAGAGLSTAAGLSYQGEDFQEHFSDFIAKYHFQDMYTAGFYPFSTLEEYWAYWSRHIYYHRYDQPFRQTYLDLLKLVKDKNYFIITTNVDHQFQIHGFDHTRLFYTQGDYGLWQCSRPCHQQTYDNEMTIREMMKKQKNMKIPTDLIPYCPYCGAPITMNLRIDQTFVEDAGWHQAKARYEQFLYQYQQSKIVYLELGVGYNTPGIIKYPFWQFTKSNPQATYICINQEDISCHESIYQQAILMKVDIHQVIESLLSD